MSTILTIYTQDPKTRVTFGQPLRSISEIQLVDYDFPETFETFETDQTIKSSDGSNTLLTISAGGYSFKTLRTVFIISNLGVVIHPTSKGYCIISKDKDVVVSRELAKRLDIPSYLFAGKYFPISWPRYKYHVHCNIDASSSVLGQITMATTTEGRTEGLKLAPTNLLAVVPSKSGIYPSIPIQTENYPINYLTLSVLDENGNKPNFGGESFRISLRVV